MSDANFVAEHQHMLNGPNPVAPSEMTAKERLNEIAAILAAGVVRLHARKSSQIAAAKGESSLDFTARQSGHEPVNYTAGEWE